MRIEVKQADFMAVMNEDGEFRCPHENVEFEYDSGGDGITEPGPSWSVHCNDCDDEDLTQTDINQLIEAHIENLNDREE